MGLYDMFSFRFGIKRFYGLLSYQLEVRDLMIVRGPLSVIRSDAFTFLHTRQIGSNVHTEFLK